MDLVSNCIILHGSLLRIILQIIYTVFLFANVAGTTKEDAEKKYIELVQRLQQIYAG